MNQAPLLLVTQADLESALTGEKLRELLGDKGKAEPTAARVKLVLENGQGAILGQIQRAVKLPSVYELWVTKWTDIDKGNLRRLVLSSCIYHAHLYGQKFEEIPESVTAEFERVLEQATDIGNHVGTLGNDPPAKSSTLHSLTFNLGAGQNPHGSPRSRWGSF